VTEAVKLIGNRYQLHEPLGKGGMGIVYRATDRLTGQIVALKQVTGLTENRELSTDDESTEFRLALAREFKVLASLRHPHIITVLDYGFDEQRQPFFTMELLDEAQSFLVAGQEKSLDDQIELLIRVLQALAYLHRRAILHRDLKPSNVLVAADGQVKVLDFGLAEESQQSKEIMGTLAYMAPEILHGQQATEAADLYAIGIMTYELLAGRHPFDTSTPPRLIEGMLHTAPDLVPLFKLEKGEATGKIDRHDAINVTKIGDDTVDIEKTVPIAKPESSPDTIIVTPIESGNLDISSHTDLSASKSLAAIVATLLAKLPTERYRDAYDVIADLSSAMQRPMPEESAAIRESFLQAATFVGRAAEFSQLETALTATIEGKGSAWLIGGESGVGKSRLLDELRTHALVQGVTVLRGQAVSGGGLPYEVWRDPLRRLIFTTQINDLEAGILKDLVPDVDDLLERTIPDAMAVEGTAYQQRLLGTIISLFQRQTQPILILLEDLQWANESLDIVRVLTGIVGELPLLIVGNYRHDERPSLPEELPSMQLLKLERLDRQSIAALSASMLGESGRDKPVIDLLQRETEGNVFFLVEVVRALAEEAGRLDNVGRVSLPQHVFAGGIQTVIQRRLARVPQEGQSLLRLAAIAGRELDLEILKQVDATVDLDEWLTSCNNSAVLEVQDGEWRFAHDKLREATLATIPDLSRPNLHRQIATAIEAAYPDSPQQAVALALHWRNAGDAAKEFRYACQAGDYGLHLSTFSDAIAHFERALELLPGITTLDSDPLRLRADLLVKLGGARKYTGDYLAATSDLEAALKLWTTIGDQVGIAQSLLELAELAYYQGDFVKATQHCEDSLTRYRAIPNEQGTARALDRLGMIAFEQGDYATAVRLSEEGLGLSRTMSDMQGMASAINTLGMTAFAQGDYVVATHYFQESLTTARASGERRKAANVLLNLGSAAGEQGDLAGARRYFEEGLEICRTIGEQRGVALILENLGFVAQLEGDYAKAVASFEESLEISRAIGNRSGSAHTLANLGHLAREQTDNETAFDYYRQALSVARDIEALPAITEVITGLAAVSMDTTRALVWLGLILNHPATFESTRKLASSMVDKLKAERPAEEVEALIEQGKAMDLETVVEEIMQIKF
jgi:eukaryotic-like serine/threonine-protein kinase